MAFMKPQYEEGSWYEVETLDEGLITLPFDLVGPDPSPESFRDYCESPYYAHEVVQGVGARLSAPGYMDCTDWTVLPDMASARQYIEDTYEVDPDTGDELA
jgi:hypothetical protein